MEAIEANAYRQQEGKSCATKSLAQSHTSPIKAHLSACVACVSVRPFVCSSSGIGHRPRRRRRRAICLAGHLWMRLSSPSHESRRLLFIQLFRFMLLAGSCVRSSALQIEAKAWCRALFTRPSSSLAKKFKKRQLRLVVLRGRDNHPSSKLATSHHNKWPPQTIQASAFQWDQRRSL